MVMKEDKESDCGLAVWGLAFTSLVTTVLGTA